MNAINTVITRLFVAVLVLSPAVAEEPGFTPIFDGETLEGWRPGDPAYWSVEDGAITGRITPEHPCDINQYLIWQGGELADFELKLESRLNGDGKINNGFQFRSRLLPDNDICGYQVDNNLGTPWLVRLYDEYGRHDLALRGERATFDADGNRSAEPLPEAGGDAWFALESWHEYHLVCIGGSIKLYMNGKLAAEIQDNDPRRAEPQGIFALQLHSGPPTEVQFRNIRLKILKPASDGDSTASAPQPGERGAILGNALAWWELDSAGRGAAHPLKSVPQFYQLQLNVVSAGAGAVPGAKCVVLEGAYFDGGKDLNVTGDQVTAYLRARDPRGAWDVALFGRGIGPEDGSFRLFARDLDGDGTNEIAFEVYTESMSAIAHFPISAIDPTAWHDIVGRYDGKEVALFCDGKPMAATPCTGALRQSEATLLIATEPGATEMTRHFHGELEDAALWSRALSDGELAALSLE